MRRRFKKLRFKMLYWTQHRMKIKSVRLIYRWVKTLKIMVRKVRRRRNLIKKTQTGRMMEMDQTMTVKPKKRSKRSKLRTRSLIY